MSAIPIEVVNESNNSELIAAISLIVSIGVAVFTLWFSRRQSKQQYASLQFEIFKMIREEDIRIAKAKKDYESISLKDSHENIKAYNAYIAVIRDSLNVFEVACYMYLKNSIDRGMFKNLYKDSIDTMCTNDIENNCYAVVLFDKEKKKETYENIFKAHKKMK
ncbi:hypothetical protein LJC02_01840 [Breznakia sp. OttesenSCG-928-G09]|nr:hypothetical protein [Breznakia sp. OttesenSCG-928-G09]